MVENRFEIDDTSIFKRICGYKDVNLKKIEELAGVDIIPRGNTLIVKAVKEKNDLVMKLLHAMSDFIYANGKEYEFDDFDLKYIITTVMSGRNFKAADIGRLKISFQDTGKAVVPKTLNQAHYITAINSHAVTIATGPAGTGKTYLAVVMALKYLLSGKVDRIILTRPAVEAGENLGYLPGDLVQKINPYLRPLYDALFDLQPFEKISKMMEKNIIEVAPLAYMRGRTLNNSFVILDEAQNTTVAQMKMFLTRLGNNSKIVISGDDTQIDIEKPKKSGLLQAMKILRDINDISFIRFTREDISRHPIVEKIVAAYEKSGYSD
ncbi:MAG TPA: PhoH family protein [Spirochaetota bacterium]|nr:PhoH family protein [Spirochaetota bacterium]HPC41806.1 PhoH family protein [Spirochaetota bacterium]HPL16144.1 PhoH family protein [Spirochaetota bacterium]HQF07527.1 PhoH family protein [Spirochaetota bacterium]HQH96258.1 PhoH family protein [Spirochaetota bacterium]